MTSVSLESALRTDQIEVFSSFPEAEAAWRRAESVCAGYPYQRFAWLSRWYEEIGEASGVQPCIASVCGGDGRPLALLPLGIQQDHGASVLVWLGQEVNYFHAPLLDRVLLDPVSGEGMDRRFAALWAAVQQALPPFDAIHLERQPDRIAGFENPFARVGGTPQEVSYQATLTGSWEQYYLSQVPRAVRKDSARRARRLAERAETSFVVARDPAMAQRITERMMEQKSQRWQATEDTTDFFALEPYRRFYTRVATECLDERLVHVSALLTGDEILATHWALLADEWMAALFSGYELGEWERLSVGTRLQEHVLRWCFAAGVSVYDFSIGSDRYKQDWSDQTTTVSEYYAPMTGRGRALMAYQQLRRSTKQIGPLVRVARMVRRQLRERTKAAGA